MMLDDLVKEIKKKSSLKKAQSSAWFFKTGKGQYGEGDVFIGLTVPEEKIIAKKFDDLPLVEIKKLLKSKIHEHRYTALLILGQLYQKSNDKNKKKIVDLYLSHTKFVNNWDLVDTSASYILGDYLYSRKRNILYKLAKSKSLWERRIAIVATHFFIRQNDFKDTLKVAELLLFDKEDLIHKAVGWMIREVGKLDVEVLKKFLNKNIKILPRTTLRYAIERFPEPERKMYLKKE